MTVDPPDPIRHLYIHVPFCPAKCSYCAFVTHVGSLKLAEAYVEAVCMEIARLRPRSQSHPLKTVYFGGGTPSMLQPPQIERIIQTVETTLGVDPEREITLEAHPATVDSGRLLGYASVGVNRLSFGAESLVPAELRAINRTHSPRAVAEAIAWARDRGFASIALDLMYGLPGQTKRSWLVSLTRALDLGVDHLSLYPLAIEPRTVFARRRREGRLILPRDEAVVAMYRSACDLLRGAGFDHYEVSNWARPGHRCRHNMAYWLNREFYGVGVGAHAYIHPYRTENVGQTGRYIDIVRRGNSPVLRTERIGAREVVAETTMLRLRLLEDGLDLVQVGRELAQDIQGPRRVAIRTLRREGLLRLEGSRLILPESAVPMANEVWSRLM